jgi:hypothetical protein
MVGRTDVTRPSVLKGIGLGDEWFLGNFRSVFLVDPFTYGLGGHRKTPIVDGERMLYRQSDIYVKAHFVVRRSFFELGHQRHCFPGQLQLPQVTRSSKTITRCRHCASIWF